MKIVKHTIEVTCRCGVVLELEEKDIKEDESGHHGWLYYVCMVCNRSNDLPQSHLPTQWLRNTD